MKESKVKRDKYYKEVATDAVSEPSFVARIESLEEGMDEMVSSIKEVGVIEPLIVKKKGRGYEVVAGHRRLIAARRANLAMIPVIVSTLEDDKAEQIKLHENLKRLNLGVVEEAVFLRRLIDERKWSQRKVAQIIGRTDGYVSQRMGMLDWGENLLRAIQKGEVSFSVGRVLNEIKNEESKAFYTDAVLRDGASLQVVQRWAQAANYDMTEKREEISGGDEAEVGISSRGYRPTCWLCGAPHSPEELITIQIDRGCAKALKDAQEKAEEIG